MESVKREKKRKEPIETGGERPKWGKRLWMGGKEKDFSVQGGGGEEILGKFLGTGKQLPGDAKKIQDPEQNNRPVKSKTTEREKKRSPARNAPKEPRGPRYWPPGGGKKSMKKKKEKGGL